MRRKLQVKHTSLNVRRSRREFQLHVILRDVRDHSSKERFRRLRPLLKIFGIASQLRRSTKTFYVGQTRSVLPNLSCREIADGTHCVCQSSLIDNLDFQRDLFFLGTGTPKQPTAMEKFSPRDVHELAFVECATPVIGPSFPPSEVPVSISTCFDDHNTLERSDLTVEWQSPRVARSWQFDV